MKTTTKNAVNIALLAIMGVVLVAAVIVGIYALMPSEKPTGTTVQTITPMGAVPALKVVDTQTSVVTKNAQEYAELFALLKTEKPSEQSWFDKIFGSFGDKAEINTGASPQENSSMPDGASDSTKDYSDTNIQVEGVMEADVVKTDGNYIYALYNNKINIVSADNGNVKIVATISAPDPTELGDTISRYDFSEMYISGDRLVIIGGYLTNSANEYRYYFDSDYETVIWIYDIADKTAPEMLSESAQCGWYNTSRMIDNKLYVISEKYCYSAYEQDELESYVPYTKSNGVKTFLPASDIFYAENSSEKIYTRSYTIITATDISTQTRTSAKALLNNGGGTVYCSADSLYVTGYDYSEDYAYRTRISRFSLDNGTISLVSTGSVEGGLLNQFSLDEKDSYLRVVTTNDKKIITYDENQNEYVDYTTVNGLYIFDKDMKLTGSITDLAEGETVHSVRFDGDIAYFVTFRQTDPLFTVDVSDETKPVILSTLKIPGFSTYLHAFGKDMLFGFGYDADEETGRTDTLKLTMFGTSDKSDVTELNTLILRDEYYSTALYDHKAILVDAEKNIIAIPLENKIGIYSYDSESGFVEKAMLNLAATDENQYFYFDGSARTVYIGDYYYAVAQSGIVSYDMTEYKLVGSVKFEVTDNGYNPHEIIMIDQAEYTDIFRQQTKPQI